MTDYKATPEQWANVQRFSAVAGESCILELRSRVEALEAASRARLIEIIRLTNAVADQVSDRNKFLADTMADEDDSRPTPNDLLVRSSLVERVADAIVGEATCAGIVNDRPARAAIREVAAWMTSNPDVYFPPALVFALEQETER
jgi:hypothetical protein